MITATNYCGVLVYFSAFMYTVYQKTFSCVFLRISYENFTFNVEEMANSVHLKYLFVD